MKIAVLNEKGGVGKTTVALLLASAMRSASMEVALQDLCPDKWATWWCIHAGNVPLLSEHPGASIVLVDTPSQLSRLGARDRRPVVDSLQTCDRVVIPTSTSAWDLEACRKTLERARALCPAETRFYILFNRVGPARVDLSDFISSCEAEGVAIVKTRLPERSSYARFAAEGWSAIQGEHRRSLVDLIFELEV